MPMNHPNRRRLPYRVRYGDHEAAFSDAVEAHHFGSWASIRYAGTLVDITLTHGEGRGLVGQYTAGRATPEFTGVTVTGIGL